MDRYFAQVLPADKADYVAKLQAEGRKVCFVGDGINDSIALKKADVSISLRGASSIATDTAQVVFLEGGLSRLCELREIARDLDRNVNRSWSMIVAPNVTNMIGVFTMGFGIMTSVVTNNVSALAALANGLLPLRKIKRPEVASRRVEATPADPVGEGLSTTSRMAVLRGAPPAGFIDPSPIPVRPAAEARLIPGGLVRRGAGFPRSGPLLKESMNLLRSIARGRASRPRRPVPREARSRQSARLPGQPVMADDRSNGRNARTGRRPHSSRPSGRRQRPAAARARGGRTDDATDPGWVIETVFSPFHCLYQDALFFHTQSRLAKSDGEASRLARAALLLYISAAEAMVHQAAEELGRHELRGLIADPSRPLPLAEAWRLLPAIAAEPGTPTGPFDPDTPPWPQFAELLMLRTSWAYPGPPASRRAYYRSARRDGDYEPLQPHQVPPALEAHRGPRSPGLPAHRPAPRSLRPPPPPPRRRARHPRRRHRGPRPPHGRRAHPGPAAPSRARPARPSAGRLSTAVSRPAIAG